MASASIILHVPIEPVAFARAGARGKVRFTPRKQADFMAQVRFFGARAMEGAPPLDGPLEMIARFTYVAPASWSEKKRAAAMWKTSAPDVDNLAKIIKDALNAVVYRDDAQIASLTAQKKYGPRAEVVVTVHKLEDA